VNLKQHACPETGQTTHVRKTNSGAAPAAPAQRSSTQRAAAAAAGANSRACPSRSAAAPAKTATVPAAVSAHIPSTQLLLLQGQTARMHRQQQHNTCLLCLPQLPGLLTCSARISSLTWPKSPWNLPSSPSMCSRMESQCLICSQMRADAAATTGYTSHVTRVLSMAMEQHRRLYFRPCYFPAAKCWQRLLLPNNRTAGITQVAALLDLTSLGRRI
jgi:hypothetical protein